MRRRLGKGLVGIGILLMLIPIVGRIYVSYKQEQLYRAYQENIVVTTAPVRPHKTEQTVVVSPELETPLITPSHLVEEGMTLGKIKIPKIKLDVLLLEGVKDKQLGLGVGHMPSTALPGQIGNCAIAGHRNYTFGSMFNRLDELDIGDKIEIEYQGQHFTYRVSKTEIVRPSELSVLAQNQEEKILTLITCHPVYSSAYRLIITGTLE